MSTHETPPKPERTVEDVLHDVGQVSSKLGILQFQLERELPNEIEKLLNQMHDLNKEGQKLHKIEADRQQTAIDEAKKSEIAKAKLSIVPETQPIEFQEEMNA